MSISSANSSGPSHEAPKTAQPSSSPANPQQTQGDKSATKPVEQQK
jgi:hypothetical protein